MRTASELVATGVLAVAHDVAGWLLIGFAILIVAVAGPRRGSRVFAALFAAVILLVVITGWSDPAAAAAPGAPAPVRTGGAGWLGAAVLGAGLVGLGFGMFLVKAALRLLGEAISALLFGLRIALVSAGLLGVVVVVLARSV